MRRRPMWVWAILLTAACGGSAYKVNRAGGSGAGGAGGSGGAGAGATAGTFGTASGGSTSATTTATGGAGGVAGASLGGGGVTSGGMGGAVTSLTGGSPGSGGASYTGGALGTATGGSSPATTATGGASGTATGGSSSTITATGGVTGAGGTTLALQPCNSSDGSGCGDPTFCVDTRSDSCWPDATSGCTGYCATRRRAPLCQGPAQTSPCPAGFACIPETRSHLGTDPVSICVGSETGDCTTDATCPTGFLCVPIDAGRRCSPDRVVCNGIVTCKMAEPDLCPGGYARSTTGGCYGPCVPVETCACSTDVECSRAGASCDRQQGRCYIPQAPEPRCQLAFDVGPCDASVRVYAFIDGECKAATYGGCAGNDNRFSSLEECLARCQGMPERTACPDGREERVVCLSCGAGGGCTLYAAVCAKTCTTQTECQSSGFSCASGFCEAAFCI